MGWNPLKELKKAVIDPIGNMAEAAVSAVGNVANVVVTTIDGGSTSDALGKLGADASKIYISSLDAASFGQGDKLDALSGGMFSASKNIGNTPQNFIEGKSVRQNLEDAARVGAVLASGGIGGVGVGMGVNAGLVGKDGQSNISLKNLAKAAGNTQGGFVGNILKSIGADAPASRPAGNTQSGYYSDIPSDIYQGEDKTNLVIPVIIIGVVATTILIIKRKRK